MPESGLQFFFQELRRRNVVRVAVVYAAVGWIIVEVAATVLPLLHLPAWAPTLVVVLVMLGFPIALVLSWAYDVTPKGLERTEPGGDAAPPADGPAPASSPPRAAPASAARRIVVVAAALLVAIGGGAFLALRDAPEPLVRNRVAVDRFENRTGDESLDVVGSMAADWLVRSLQQHASLEVMPVTASLAMASLSGDGGPASRAHVLGTELGARLVVSGSYYLEGDSLRFVAEVTDAERRELLHTAEPVSAPREAPSRGLDELQSRVAGFLATWGDLADMGFEESLASRFRPPEYDAYREYMTGTELFVRGQYRAAQPHLARAVELDSTFLTAIARAATAHTNLGEYEEAEPYVERARRIRNQLTPYERLWADWLDANQRGDRRAALRASRRLAEMQPYSVAEYLVALIALRLNRLDEALDYIERIRPDGSTALNWKPYWNVRADIHHLRGEDEASLTVARRARELNPDYGWHAVREIAALIGLGRLDEVEARLDDALDLPADGRPPPGGVLLQAATELRAHGHEELARSAAERAVTWFRTRGAENAAALGRALYLAGRWREARAVFEALLAEQPGNINWIGYLGTTAARLGDAEEARRRMAELAAIDQPYTFGNPTRWRADIAALLGERVEALALLRQAVSEGQRLNAVHLNMDLLPLRGYPPFEEFMRPRG